MLNSLIILGKENLHSLSVVNEEQGQGLVEYALIVVLISVVAIAVMTVVGGDIVSVFDQVSIAIKSAFN